MSAPDVLLTLADGRRLALDDRGDPAGRPVLYLHGTPDARMARHPDDDIAAAAGVRLLAVDRPGIGGSDADPSATPQSVAADLVEAIDHLDMSIVSVLAWSAGAIFATAFAGTVPERIDRLVLAAPLIPADAYGIDGILEGANDGRRTFAGLLTDMTPAEIGIELAPFLVPPGCDPDTAGALLADAVAAVTSVPGAGDALVKAMCAAVENGMTGLERDVAAQAIPLGPLLDACPRAVVHAGTDDEVAPVAMGSWYADRLGGMLVLHQAGHELGITRWGELLADATTG